MDQLRKYILLGTLWLVSAMSVAQDTSAYKLILTLSQPAYVPGDTIYFQTLLVVAEDTLDVNRRVAKVTLVSEQGKAVTSINMLFQRGRGFNQLALPVGLEAGSYQLSFTFHGPYFNIKSTSFPLPILFDDVPFKVLPSSPFVTYDYDRINLDAGSGDLQLKTRERAGLSMQQLDGISDRVDGLCLNLLYNDAFQDIDFSYVHQQSDIILTTRPQARIILEGTAYQLDNRPLPDSTLLIFYQQSKRQLYQTITTRQGKFRLELLDFYGYDRLLIGARINGKLLKDVPVTWDNVKIEEGVAEQRSAVKNAPEGYSAYKTNKQLIDRSYEFFLSEDSFNVPIIKVPPIQIKHDVSYDLTRYIVFKTMGELLRTIIRPLYFGTIDGKEVVRVKFIEETLTDQDPLYFIDGVATYDTERFLALPTEHLTSMKIVTNPRTLKRFGTLGKHGIVIVETNRPASNQYSKHEIVPGLSQQRTPAAFQPKVAEEMPQFVVNTKWIPDYAVEEDSSSTVEFNLSDDAGTYLLILSGFDKELGFFSTKRELQVTPK